MFRTALICFFCIIAILPLNAARSNRLLRMVTQPDNTKLSVRLMGDENIHWYQTSDGVLLHREADAFYIASVTKEGTLENSGVLAHDAGMRPKDEIQAIEAQNRSAFIAFAQQSQLKALSGYPSASFCPHVGTVKVPVILMNYLPTEASDIHLSFSKDVYEEYFNGTEVRDRGGKGGLQGYGSVARYFSDASLNKLDMQFDLYGPYTADKVHDYYGFDNGKSKELLTEAVAKADGDIDFSQYDSNGDGMVDMVYILYAGTGANLSGDDSDFWPACWRNMNISTDDGPTIKIIGAANELCAYSDISPTGENLLAGIGVTVHEMSHGMGLPDLYWTLSTTPKDGDGRTDYNNCGPEIWDIMDDGENIYNGIWPCTYSAWERDVMGWTQLRELTEPAEVTIYPISTTNGEACRVTNPNAPNEYYVLENIETDKWNYYLSNAYGKGLMITHVRMTDTGLSMAPNNVYGKPNVTILPADGYLLSSFSQGYEIMYRGVVTQMPSDNKSFQNNYFLPEIKGDPYPGSKNVSSVAAYNNYSGEDMASLFSITDIVLNADGSVSFKFMGGDDPTFIKNALDSKDDSPIYTIDGRRVMGDEKSLPRGLYIKNGRLFCPTRR